MSNRLVGKAGMLTAIAVFSAMAAAAYMLAPGNGFAESPGLCLPQADRWPLAPLLSWGINYLVLGICAMMLANIDRKFNLVQGTDLLLPAAFLIMTASCPWDVQRLCSGSVMALANIASLWMLFGCSERRDNTHRLFAIASFLSLGSATQPAFLLMIPVYAAGAVLMKIMGVREAAAFLCGLAAPYLSLLGLGIVSPQDFSFVWNAGQMDFGSLPVDVFAVALCAGFTILWSSAAGFSNLLRLLKSNVETRRHNTVIMLLGLAAAAGCLFNFSNLTVYLPTLCVAAAVQLSQGCSPAGSRVPPAVPLMLMAVYIASFVLITGFL